MAKTTTLYMGSAGLAHDLGSNPGPATTAQTLKDLFERLDVCIVISKEEFAAMYKRLGMENLKAYVEEIETTPPL